MNYLHQKSIQFFCEISIISLTFLLAFQIPVLAQSWEISHTVENQYVYQNNSTKNLSIVGVAITTNLWTRHSQISSLPVTIYKDVLSIEEVLATSDTTWDDFISQNMLLLKEYRNISSTDIQSLLNQTYDKSETLKAYLDMLKNRYDIANTQIVSLEQQKQVFESTMEQTNTQIDELKNKISNDFSSVNTQATNENIDSYLELKNKYTTARMYVIFINKFLEQYSFLNEYNIAKADILLKNSEAIIKDAYIVIPESWDTQLLQDLNLIIEDS